MAPNKNKVSGRPLGGDEPVGYPLLLAEIKERVRSAQYAALKAVNKELVGLYWDIGRLIVERQADEGWGKAVVEQLATDLRAAFPGVGGFSASNPWRMKAFFETYSSLEKLAPLVREIGWTHNLAILERCKEPLEREFYLRMTRKFGWSKNVLIHQIESQSYEKSLLGQTNFDQALTPELRAQARLAVKDEYIFDFLDLGGEHGERELERALIARIEDFLRAMGGLYAFVGSQFRLEVDGDEYYIDLLLYHRRLKALVALDLKIGKFQPEFVGKMQFYLAALDRLVRLDGENPSIGIILCKEKNRTVVEYALHDARKPIGVATYEITRKLPKALQGLLPSPEEIAKLLEDLCPPNRLSLAPCNDGPGVAFTALHELLLQSHDGAIRILPAVAADWSGMFQLRAEGGFLVGVAFEKGVAKAVEIRSELGKECVVENPWYGECVVWRGRENTIETDDAIIRLQMETTTDCGLEPQT